MIFVDTNVFMYAVGREHPLREEARRFFADSAGESSALVTSAEVLQELLHAYLPVGRISTLGAAFDLVDGCVVDVWDVEAQDVRVARDLSDVHAGLGARDLIHVACCKRREISRVMTFDRALRAVMAA